LIVIFIDNIEEFAQFLHKRIMDEIFYEFRKSKKEEDLSSKSETEVIFHFLSKVETSLILYETKLTISSQNKEQLIKQAQEVLNKVDNAIKFVKGKIREIFLSYSF